MSGLVLTGPRHLWVPLILRTAGGRGSRSFGESEPLDVTGLSCDLPCLSDLGAPPVPEQCPTCGGGRPPLPPLWGGSYSTSPFEPRSRGSHRDPHMPVGKGHLCPHGPGGSLSLLPCPPPPSQELLSPSTQRPFSLSPFQGRKGDRPPLSLRVAHCSPIASLPAGCAGTALGLKSAPGWMGPCWRN